MDIQSSALDQLFVLYPLIIQGAVTPVKPDGIADVGVSRALVSADPRGLEVLADPWSELKMLASTKAAHDRIDVYLEGNPNPVTGKTIAPGEEDQRVALYILPEFFIQGVNWLYYVVTRVGRNSETSRKLSVLYNLRASSSLALTIPPDVLAKGVDAARAAQGVLFTFTYNNRRPFDRIEFLLGDTIIRFNVPDAPAPITVTLFTEAFKKAGDSPDAVAEFYVIDQLGNRAQSPEQTLDIHLSRPLELPAPTVRGQTGNNFSPTQPEIRVLVPKGSLLPGDKLTVHWQGATAVADGSYTSPQRLVSAGLEIAVPRSVLAYSLGKFVTVTYIIERNGVSTTSLPLTLNILKLPDSALIPPKILEANASNVLDVVALGSKAATVHALLWTLIEAGQQVWMTLEGKKANGTAHNLTVWNGSDSKVNATWVNQGFWPYTLANSYLKQLGDRSTLTIKFKASLDKSNNAATATVFPDRFYTIRAEVDTWKDSVTDFANGTTGNWTIGPAGRYGRVTGGLFQNDTAIGVSGFAGVVFSQNFLFSAGRTYSFSISVRNNGPVAHLLPSFSVTLGSGQIILPAATVPKSGEWIQRVASFTVAQTGNQTISIMSHQDRGSGSGTDGGNDYQIDNITVTRRP